MITALIPTRAMAIKAPPINKPVNNRISNALLKRATLFTLLADRSYGRLHLPVFSYQRQRPGNDSHSARCYCDVFSVCSDEMRVSSRDLRKDKALYKNSKRSSLASRRTVGCLGLGSGIPRPSPTRMVALWPFEEGARDSVGRLPLPY